MALCESQLDSALPQIKSEEHEGSPVAAVKSEDMGHDNSVSPQQLLVPLGVDYRSPRSHFVPPEVELYSLQTSRRLTSQHSGSNTSLSTVGSNASGVPAAKRKRGRPRVDKTSPEYLAKSAARKQAREMVAMMNSSSSELGEKRKRGRPRIDKTSPEYLARKRAKELEALEKKAKRQYKRRGTGAKVNTKTPTKNTKMSTRSVKKTPQPPAAAKAKVVARKVRKIPQKLGKTVASRNTGKEKKVVIRRNSKFVKRKKDSAASSSAGDSTPHAKRKYTKKSAGANNAAGADTTTKRGRKKKIVLGPDGNPITPSPSDKTKGKRGRPRKCDLLGPGHVTPNSTPKKPQARIRVRNNLMPVNSEPITVDSDEEVDLGSPGHSDSLSLDENLRAIRHLHEKYANIAKDDLYEAHLLPTNFKKPMQDGVPKQSGDQDDVVSVRSTPGRDSVKDNTDDDSGDESSSSDDSSSSSSSGSSSSSDSSDSESEASRNGPEPRSPNPPQKNNTLEDDGSFGAWSYKTNSDSDTSSDPERSHSGAPEPEQHTASLSESENESADKSFQCAVCHKWYSTIVTLKIHRRVHVSRGSGGGRARARSTDRYECDCCDQVFSRREKLWDHKASAHRGAMTVRCEVCRKCFEDDSELATHSKTHTQDERAGRCSSCGARFPRYEQLRRHMSAAHGSGGGPHSPAGAHACPQCGKSFGHAHSLTRHLHNHAKQLYRCVVCKASFGRADQLAQHLNSHLANYKRLKP